MATLYLEVGTPAEYPAEFLRDLAGAYRSDVLSAPKSTLPTGVTVTGGGMAGTPEDMSAGPYELIFTDSYGNTTATLDILEGTPTLIPLDVPLTAPTTELEAGVPYVVDVLAAGPDGSEIATVTGDVPDGMAVTEYGETIAGTPATAGDYPLTIDYQDMMGDPLPGTVETTLSVTAAAIVIPAPAAQATEDGYMLPDVAGAQWLVDGQVTAPGTYSVQPVTETTTVTIVPEPLDGWIFDPPAEPLTLTFEPAPDPDPDPDPDPEPPQPIPGDYPGPGGPEPAPDDPSPEDEALWARLMDDDPQAMFVATKLAERIIRHVGRDVADLDPSEVLTARDHAMVILEYVKGYTRDRGFIGYAPHRSLQAVIVAAGSRLFTNPEQVTYYATGDYSERPATMTGWTAAELGVLRRFRKVFA